MPVVLPLPPPPQDMFGAGYLDNLSALARQSADMAALVHGHVLDPFLQHVQTSPLPSRARDLLPMCMPRGGGWLSAVIWAFGDNLAMLLLSWECNAGNALLHNTTLQLYVSIILQYRQHSFEQCSVCCTLWATRIYPPPRHP